jgi:hypothetical protein
MAAMRESRQDYVFSVLDYMKSAEVSSNSEAESGYESEVAQFDIENPSAGPTGKKMGPPIS